MCIGIHQTQGLGLKLMLGCLGEKVIVYQNMKIHPHVITNYFTPLNTTGEFLKGFETTQRQGK